MHRYSVLKDAFLYVNYLKLVHGVTSICILLYARFCNSQLWMSFFLELAKICERRFKMSKLIYCHLHMEYLLQLLEVLHLEGERHRGGDLTPYEACPTARLCSSRRGGAPQGRVRLHLTCPLSVESRASTGRSHSTTLIGQPRGCKLTQHDLSTKDSLLQPSLKRNKKS